MQIFHSSGDTNEKAPAVNEEPPESHEAPDAISSIKIMQFKRPRYSRRIQSKSEPYHDPVEVGPKLDQVIDEASEPDSSQDSVIFSIFDRHHL